MADPNEPSSTASLMASASAGYRSRVSPTPRVWSRLTSGTTPHVAPDTSSGPPSKRTRATHHRRTLDTFPACTSVVGEAPLSSATLLHIRAAMNNGSPLHVQMRLSALERDELLRDWSTYVKGHATERYQTAGRSAACRPLGEVWRSASRIESGLKGETDNPIRDWLASPSRRDSVRRRMQGVQLQLDALTSARCKQLAVGSETKAFIAGRVKPGGGPSHYDSYDNLALVLSGSKVFYHAPPHALEQVPLHGEVNERLSVNPFDDVTLNAPVYCLDVCDCQGVALAPLWRAAALEAGDLLFLPHRWWHWVWSEPATIMTNNWIDRSEHSANPE